MTDHHFDTVVSDLETYEHLGKATLTSILRMLAGDAQEGELLTVLERFKEEKEREIHELCGSEYKALLAGLQVVGGVTEAAVEARAALMGLQSGISEVSAGLLAAKAKVAPIQAQIMQFSTSQSSLQALQSAVQTLKKAQNQISHQRLLSALRNIKESKAAVAGLKTSKAGLLLASFAEKLEDSVARQVEEMLSEWLLGARKGAETIGASLFADSYVRICALRAKNAKRQEKADWDPAGLSLRLSQVQPRRLNHYLTARESLTHTPATRLSVVLEESHLSSLNFPLLCQLETVFQELNRERDFLDSLKRNRRAQILQVSSLSLPVRTRLELLASHLCIEKELSAQDDRWRPDEELQELWLEVISAVTRMVEELVRQAKLSEDVLGLKEAMTLFIETLQRAGFTQRCYELLELMRNHHWAFFSLLVDNFKSVAEQVVGEDDYTPLAKDSPFESLVKQFELDIPGTDAPTHRFSSLVPRMCNLFSAYTQRNLAYLSDLQDTTDDLLFRNTDRLLHVLSDIITDQTRSVTVLQTGMLAVDVTFLFQALNAYYVKLVEEAGSVKDFSARAAFMQLKDTCEQAIFSKIQDRMRELLGTITDLAPAAAHRHDWVSEALLYLEHTASNLEHLCGQQVAATALVTSIKYISTSLLHMLEVCPKFNSHFILELNLVGKEVEDFIAQSPICRETPGLLDSLEDLKQLTNLFITNDLESLLSAQGRQSKYPRLSLQLLVGILERYKEVKGQNPKGSVVKNVLKKLREMIKTA